MKATAYSRILCLPFLAGLFSGCLYQMPPGTPQTNTSTGISHLILPAAMAAGGAAIGDSQGGKNGAMLGAVGGLALGAVADAALSGHSRAQTAEASEAAAREERVKIMRDYHESHATNGGNNPRATATGGASAPTGGTTTIQYPAGVYDGILYGPREVQVPDSKQSK